MGRVFLIVLDGFGVGGAPDAGLFGDAGANTLGHIAEACARGLGDQPGLRQGPLKLPSLDRLGLGAAGELATGIRPPGLDYAGAPQALWGVAQEISKGKDTPSGHWEIAGFPVPFDWGYFPKKIPCFPEALVADFVAKARLPGILGNKHASGTAIIAELGEEHIKTGQPICYTSADSVLQIAAHESYFGLERLYQICQIARELTYPLNIGRVIARPFTGGTPESFTRTGNRRDYAIAPPEDTVLDRLKAAGRQVIGVGKISDIFAGKGITRSLKAHGNDVIFETVMQALDLAEGGDLVFANFVDFDMLYGHRRDVPGYAAALEAFDARLPQLMGVLRAGDLVILTADHGCDPTWTGSDHTREQAPVLAFGPDITPRCIGVRGSFADIGQSVAERLALEPGPYGQSFLSETKAGTDAPKG